MVGTRITGIVRCPDGDLALRREIAINKDDTDTIPETVYPIRSGTCVTLYIGRNEYNTFLRRYENSSYIADAYRIMGFHLKDILSQHRLDKRGTKILLEIKGHQIHLVFNTYSGKSMG